MPSQTGRSASADGRGVTASVIYGHRPMRIGFLGAGLIATYHSKSIRRSGVEVERAGVHDIDADRAAAFAAASGHHLCATEDEVLDGCDAVYICTWTSEHPRLVAAAAARGLHVFCEKPLATSLAAAEEMAATVAGAGVTHQVGLVLRHSPAYLWARHLVTEPAAGRVMTVVFRDDQFIPIQGHYSSSWRADVNRAGAGTLLEHSIHDIDMLHALVGPIADLSARSSSFHGLDGIEDVMAVSVRFDSGATGTLTSVWHDNLARPSLRRVEVLCERRLVTIEGDDWFGPVHWQDADGTTATLEGPALADAVAAASLLEGPTNPDGAFLTAAMRGEPAFPGFDVAVAAHRVADATYRSAARGGALVTMRPTVVEIDAQATYGLRRRVLREGTPGTEVVFPLDDDPTTFHLGVIDGTEIVAIATFLVSGTELRPGQRATQLRGMAVKADRQGHGLGDRILSAAMDRLRGEGVEVLWANARDSALGFYERLGMTVVGDGFMSEETQIPHHVVVIDLA